MTSEIARNFFSDEKLKYESVTFEPYNNGLTRTVSKHERAAELLELPSY